jgi:hypothetical protein
MVDVTGAATGHDRRTGSIANFRTVTAVEAPQIRAKSDRQIEAIAPQFGAQRA